jgi:hypothetical protein
MAKKKSKKPPTDPFQIPHEIAEVAIGGPLFSPKKNFIRKPKQIQRRKKATTTKVVRRKSKRSPSHSRGTTHKRKA